MSLFGNKESCPWCVFGSKSSSSGSWLVLFKTNAHTLLQVFIQHLNTNLVSACERWRNGPRQPAWLAGCQNQLRTKLHTLPSCFALMRLRSYLLFLQFLARTLTQREAWFLQAEVLNRAWKNQVTKLSSRQGQTHASEAVRQLNRPSEIWPWALALWHFWQPRL